MTRGELIKAIEDFSERSGYLPTTVCQYAIRNRGFYDKLKAGGNFHYDSATRLMEWIRANRNMKTKRKRRKKA